MSRPTLLIPIVFPDPESYPLTDMNLEGLSEYRIVLFGYWEVPETTSPKAARDAHETEAMAVLYETAAHFSHAGAMTDITLHFGPSGPEKNELQDRIVEERNADGILIPQHLSMVNNILVPLRDDRKRDKIVDFVSGYDTEQIFVLELYHVAPDRGAVDEAERMLEGVRGTLLDRGFSESDIEITVEVRDDPGAAIVDRARNHHLVVIGETEERQDEDRFLGPVYRFIAERTDTPIVVIQG